MVEVDGELRVTRVSGRQMKDQGRIIASSSATELATYDPFRCIADRIARSRRHGPPTTTATNAHRASRRRMLVLDRVLGVAAEVTDGARAVDHPMGSEGLKRPAARLSALPCAP
jgi:hypothetical protein